MLRHRSRIGLALLAATTWFVFCSSARAVDAWDPFNDGRDDDVPAWDEDWTDGSLGRRTTFTPEPALFSGLFDAGASCAASPSQADKSFEDGVVTVSNFVDPVAYLFVESAPPRGTSRPATATAEGTPTSGYSMPSPDVPLTLTAPIAFQNGPNTAPEQLPSSRDRGGNSNAVPGATGNDPSTYGKKPDETAQTVERRQFLRTQSPLMKKGDYQFDLGAAYTLFEFNFPAFDAGGSLVRGDLRRRTLVSPFALRYGWSDRTQLFVNVPAGWRNTELATSPFTTANPLDDSSSYGGVGDITLGATYLLRRSFKELPDAVVTISGGLPTGEKSVLSNATQGGLGTGFGSLGGQLLLIHTYDPFVLFWGGGYNHYFAGHIQGTPVQLGDQISYQVGAGFALNDRVTLSTGFLGSYILQTTVNGRQIKNSQQEPVRFRSALTLVRCKRIIEPFCEIGMTQSSPAYRTGVTWTF